MLKLTFAVFTLLAMMANITHAARTPISALYIPLADHYAALVAYERYRDKMTHADFQLTQMSNWDLLRAKFQEGNTDMAFVMTPLALDMYNQKPHFQWIGLMHRDGNALAINDKLNALVQVPERRVDRVPDDSVALALKQAYEQSERATEIAMPHILSTHSVVLYRYLKEHGLTMDIETSNQGEVVAIATAPPRAPAFLKSKSNRAQFAAFEQSLPWADVVETQQFGKVAWYSKDVMPWKNGHVECIAIATKSSIRGKESALREVMYYIHRAGHEIEQARNQGGSALDEIVTIIRKHIPKHTEQAIIASLDSELAVINYKHLNIDKPGLKLIMDYALEAGILKKPVDLDAFSNDIFSFQTP